MSDSNAPAANAPLGPVAYLTGQYPRATDTFIQREVAALRAHGVDIKTYTIRKTDATHHVGPEQKAEYAATFAVLEAARNPLTAARAHGSLLRHSPKAYLRALALAAKTSSPGVLASLTQCAYFLEAGVLARELKKNKTAHLHNHFANSSCSVAMLASALADVSFSFTMHGPAIFFEPRKWRIDEKIARAAFVSCISNFCRSQGMIFADPQHWDKMHIVHCGVTPARYAAARDARPDGPTRLATVLRLDPIKGVRVLIDALAALSDSGRDLEAVIIGDGPLRAELEAEAADRGLGDAIRFAGYLSQDAVAEELRRADIFVLPSFAEGVPVVLMEAMASGLPVVATQVGGVSELVDHQESGLLTPPGDIAALIDALARLIDDPALRAQYGAHGRQVVERAFDVDKEALKLKRLIAASIERRTSPAGDGA